MSHRPTTIPTAVFDMADGRSGDGALLRQPERTSELRRLLDERILVIDGAMGTMIQSYGLSEGDYRGRRFADHKFP
jgi:hypothetical protein